MLQRQPDNLHALMQCVMEERALGRPAEAGRLLGLGLQVDENHTGVLMQFAAQARLAEDEEAALLWCYRAMAADPKLLQPYLEASRVALALGRVKLAFALLDHAEKVVGREPALLARRLELLRLIGENIAGQVRSGGFAGGCRRPFRSVDPARGISPGVRPMRCGGTGAGPARPSVQAGYEFACTPFAGSLRKCGGISAKLSFIIAKP